MSEPAADVPAALDAWLRTLQQALQLEAQQGFIDLQGRQSRFSDFMATCLLDPPGEIAPEARHQLLVIKAGFADYSSLTLSRRQSLVRQCRQRLHQLRRSHEPPPSPLAPPRLRLTERSERTASAPLQDGTLSLETPLLDIRGIGPRTCTRLAGLGLYLVRDLLHHYPRDYLDYANLVRISGLEIGRTATIVAKVRRCHAFVSPRNANLAILELQLVDPTGRIRVSKFQAGRRMTSPAWLRSQQRIYPPGATVAVSGLVKQTPYGPAFQDPLLEVLEHAGAVVQSESIGRLLPVYGLTDGLSADRMRQAIAAVLPCLAGLPESLTPEIRRRFDLPLRSEALHGIHLPRNRDHLEASRRRLVFEEFLLLQLGLQQRRHRLRRQPAEALSTQGGTGPLLQRFLQELPFPLTAAQQRVLGEIQADLARSRPMARLVQGDVGSGKTVVAVAALLSAISAGCQGALMAPTEVLAEQHYAKLCSWMPQLHVSCALLTGSTPMQRRRQLLVDLANGQLKLLVGTHALLEDPVQFQRLGLVVVDEQHRFGVAQRNRLLAKGLQPHLLTTTATPIPRTLALSLYGDLDVSQIDELPPGRTPIRTTLLRASQREQAFQLIREQVAQGQRAYVVLPLVDESEKMDLRSAVETHRQLSDQVFPDLNVGLLHGRLASAEKQAAISAFSRGDVQVLVSTTVVEVGVDVPEASVMVIEHAERFGLAQLHQLRGRVGRGAAASHCLLINSSNNAQARQRLEVLAHSGDGFEIAEMDLRIRGPGQVLGTRQSGLPDLALASLTEDGELLELTRELARCIIASDPELKDHEVLGRLLAEQRQRAVQGAQLN
ncbi:MAG: ATP-dependent DNA helicase RecG [Cyanobacteriota bacterium]|nr:ATP-dependent DNA helicase RecG [Cyanobacteriota bacterium]